MPRPRHAKIGSQMSSENQDPWEPIEIGQLRVGHYIKINHRWFDHPFVRRMFQISSEREIQTIRDVELTRIFVDQKRSAPDPSRPAEGAPVAPQAVPEEPDPEQKKAAEAAAIKAEREALAAAQMRGRVTLERAQYVLAALNYADNHSATL